MNVVQIPANANSGRLSLSANHTTSFFFVSGFGYGAYSAKLLAGTKQRFSGFSQLRRGDDALRMFVTGASLARGDGGLVGGPAEEMHICRKVLDRSCASFRYKSLSLRM